MAKVRTISGSVGFWTFSYYSSRSMDGIWEEKLRYMKKQKKFLEIH